MSKTNKDDFYEDPQPQLFDEDATGITLGFYSNGKSVSDFRLNRFDIEFLAEEFIKWLNKYHKDEAV